LSSKHRNVAESRYALVANVNPAPGGNVIPLGFFGNFHQYKLVLGAMFSCLVVLSLMDLVTTSIALRQGLSEGNVMLLGISSWMRLGFFQTIIATKIGFILGAGTLVFLGWRSDLQTTRKIVLFSMFGFVLMLFLVSLNNLILILN
jgi:hypothetical protein